MTAASATSFHSTFKIRAINSPHILELSGVGQPEILSKIGVDVVVNLSGVGENVQEHSLVGVPFELPIGEETLESLLDPVYAAKARELQLSGETCGVLEPE